MMGRVGFVNRTVYWPGDNEYFNFIFCFTDRTIMGLEKRWQEYQVCIWGYVSNEEHYFEFEYCANAINFMMELVLKKANASKVSFRPDDDTVSFFKFRIMWILKQMFWFFRIPRYRHRFRYDNKDFFWDSNWIASCNNCNPLFLGHRHKNGEQPLYNNGQSRCLAIRHCSATGTTVSPMSNVF